LKQWIKVLRLSEHYRKAVLLKKKTPIRNWCLFFCGANETQELPQQRIDMRCISNQGKKPPFSTKAVGRHLPFRSRFKNAKAAHNCRRYTNPLVRAGQSKSQIGYNRPMTKTSEFDLYRPEPLLIVISGPSGVGKDTVLRLMEERNESPFHFVVTATTRPIREGEIHGVDYFFVSNDEFAKMIEENELLEYAVVYNDYKGIPKQQVRDALASGKDVIMRLDVQGAATLRKMAPEAVTIFLTTESEEALVNRLKARKSETAEGLNLRIAAARQEMKRADEFDYIVINREGHMDEAVDTIQAIIQAEHHRTRPRKVNL
jgi:guanylate kinase